ncbi:MAG: hypothetical protein HY074_08085 [Deltaproteobacteria bacterium]|nr:hypothetical protein [Deltaproteobacteria bacterium]
MKLHSFYVVLALGFVCAVIFSQTRHFGLLTGDDNFNILYNPYLRPLDIMNLMRIWSGFYLKLYIPVTLTTWAILGKIALVTSGVPGAFLFHAANVILHWLNGVLVFTLLRSILKTPSVNNPPGRHPDFIALLGALLFVCHPLQAVTVAWVTGLKDVLSASFGLLALHALLRADIQLRRKDSEYTLELQSYGMYLAASAAFALSVLSKPNMIVLPFLGVLLGAVVKKDWRGCLIATAPWLAAGIILTLLTAEYQAELNPGTLAPPWVRPFAALDAISFYIKKTILPHPLPHEYGDRLTEVRRHAAPFWLDAAGSAVFLAALVRLRRRMPQFCAGFFFAVAALLPILGFVPYTHQQFCDVANRYMYFPMVGVSLCFASLLRSIRGAGVLAAATALIMAFTALSYKKVQTFANDDVFYGEVLRYDPGNHFATGNLSTSLLRRGKLDEALHLALDDFRRNPWPPRSLYVAIEALLALGRSTEAVMYLKDFAKKYGDTAELHFNLGHVLILSGNWQAGVDELQRAGRSNPQMTRMSPPDFISEFLDLRREKISTQGLLQASQAAPHFRSLQLLLELSKNGRDERI